MAANPPECDGGHRIPQKGGVKPLEKEVGGRDQWGKWDANCAGMDAMCQGRLVRAVVHMRLEFGALCSLVTGGGGMS